MRRTYAHVVLAVFAIALAMRTIPLYWSPLPSTLDSFAYAGLARDTLAVGHYPLSSELRADFFILTILTAMAGEVSGEQPLYIIQPMVSIIGSAIVLVGVALTRRLALDMGWPSQRARQAALVTGLLLAVQGLFLRRTTVPDPEVLGILLALLGVLALYRILWAEDNRWVVPFAIILVTFPILHIFSTFNVAVMLAALYALSVAAKPSRRTILVGGVLVATFWAVFVGYYELAERLALFRVSYVGQVRSNPGLFVGWIVALALGAAWYQRVSSRLQRGMLLAPLGVLFVLVILNVFRPIYPGTIQSPPEVAFLISLLVVPVVFAGYGAPALSAQYRHASAVLAMLAGPLVIVYFSLTASLTPDFFATGMRAQTFMHVPAFVLVGLAAASVFRSRVSVSWRMARRGAICVLVVCTLLTAPLAFVALDTFNYPSTTMESEFEATGFASGSIPGSWATHHPPDRIASHYLEGGESVEPVRQWLGGGQAPSCPVLLQESWVTHGAYLWPAQPQVIDGGAYETFLFNSQVVYTNNGRDAITITAPRDGGSEWSC